MRSLWSFIAGLIGGFAISRTEHERILWSLRQELHETKRQLADVMVDNHRLKILIGERHGRFVKMVATNDAKR